MSPVVSLNLNFLALRLNYNCYFKLGSVTYKNPASSLYSLLLASLPDRLQNNLLGLLVQGCSAAARTLHEVIEVLLEFLDLVNLRQLLDNILKLDRLLHDRRLPAGHLLRNFVRLELGSRLHKVRADLRPRGNADAAPHKLRLQLVEVFFARRLASVVDILPVPLVRT